MTSTLKKIFEEIKIDKYIFILIFYFLGLINVIFYFKEFNVNILKFLTINDLLFFSIEFLIQFFLLLLFSFIFLFILILLISIFFKNKNLKVIKKINNITDFLSLFFLLFFAFSFEIMNYNINYILVIFTTIIIKLMINNKYLFFLFNTENKFDVNDDDFSSGLISFLKKRTYKIKIPIYLFIIIFGIRLFSSLTSKYVKKGNNKSDIEVSFIYNKNLYSTYNNSNTFYVGETYECLFLFNSKTNSTQIFYKNQLNNYNILSKNDILEQFIKKITTKHKN